MWCGSLPTHTQDDDFAVKMTAVGQQVNLCLPTHCVLAIVKTERYRPAPPVCTSATPIGPGAGLPERLIGKAWVQAV